MSDRLIQAVRALVAQRILSIECGIPISLIAIVSMPFFEDVLAALAEMDGRQKYGPDDLILWVVDYMVERVRQTSDAPEDAVVEMQHALRGMLDGVDLTPYPDLRQRIDALITEDNLDLSIWENFMEDTNGPVV